MPIGWGIEPTTNRKPPKSVIWWGTQTIGRKTPGRFDCDTLRSASPCPERLGVILLNPMRLLRHWSMMNLAALLTQTIGKG